MDGPGSDPLRAAANLAGLEERLAVAFWRRAHAAAVEATLSTFAHDLRGVLSPALLSAEALGVSDDARVRRAATSMMQAVERAAALIRNGIGRLHADAPGISGEALPLGRLLRDVTARLPPSGATTELAVPDDARVRARPDCLALALKLLLHAVGDAPTLILTATVGEDVIELTLAGEGAEWAAAHRMTLATRAIASVPPDSACLALATARDLLLAQRCEVDVPELAGLLCRVTLRAA